MSLIKQMVVLHSPHDDGAQYCSVLHMDILPKSFYLDKMTKVQIIEYEMNVKWKLCCHYAWDHFSNSTKRGKERKEKKTKRPYKWSCLLNISTTMNFTWWLWWLLCIVYAPSPSDLRICYMLPERNWVFLSVILVIYHIVYYRNKFHIEKRCMNWTQY